MRIISVQERDACSISYSEIINPDGTLRFLDFARNRGLIEIRQSRTGLELKIGGVVGRLPISPELSLDIAPKFPIANLSRLLSVSGEAFTRIAPIERFYGTEPNNGSLPEALIRSFVHYLRNLLEIGIHKSYRRTQLRSIPRPRIDFHRSQQAFWSRQKLATAYVELFEFASDNMANQIIKAAILKSLGLSRGHNQLDDEHQFLTQALRYFDAVSTPFTALDAKALYRALQEIPTFREAYFRVAPVALEILRGSNLLHNLRLNGVLLPSFLLELETIFESYIRNILRNLSYTNRSTLKIRNGNAKKWSKFFLDDNKSYRITPDFLIYTHNEQPRIVGDVKYKIRPTKDDRYQVIAHTLSYRSRIALLIYPCTLGQKSEMKKLGTLGPPPNTIDLYEYHFDLSADLATEENQMFQRISDVVA